MRVTFTIPGPPRGKDRARSTARIVGYGADARAIVTVYSDPEMEAAEREIARLYKIAAGGRVTITGPVQIKIIAVFAMPPSWPRKTHRIMGPETIWHRGAPDMDNIGKLVCDGLNKVAWVDDGQIAVMSWGKRYGEPERVEVTIEALPQHPDAVPPAQRLLERRVAQEGWDAVLAPAPRRSNASKTPFNKRRR
jgi:Holliday junction resolvase RusA-like endonuclease